MRSMIFPVVAMLWIAAAALPAQAQIPWNNDLQAAHAQAKQEGKQLLMHFYTDNCVWCDRLEAGAFQSAALAAAIEKDFVPVKIHAGMNPNIAKTFRVTRFPTDVIVTTDGNVLSHGVSPQDPQAFVSLLAQHAAKTPPPNALVQKSPVQESPVPAAPSPVGPPAPMPRAVANDSPRPDPAASVRGPSQPKANPYAPPAVVDPASAPPASPQGFSLPTNRLPAQLGGTPANVAGYRPQTNPLAAAASAGPSGTGPSATMPAPEPTVRSQEPVPSQGATVSGEQITIAPELEANLTDQPERSAPEASAADGPAPAKTPPVALQGFCPVALAEKGAWVAGDPAFGSIHLGQLYLFADQASLETFQANPEPYTPVMNGNDVVLFFEEHRVVEGRRDWGLWDPEFNRVFLFATEETMNHFYEHHQDYVRSAIALTRQAALEANSTRR